MFPVERFSRKLRFARWLHTLIGLVTAHYCNKEGGGRCWVCVWGVISVLLGVALCT